MPSGSDANQAQSTSLFVQSERRIQIIIAI